MACFFLSLFLSLAVSVSPSDKHKLVGGIMMFGNWMHLHSLQFLHLKYWFFFLFGLNDFTNDLLLLNICLIFSLHLYFLQRLYFLHFLEGYLFSLFLKFLDLCLQRIELCFEYHSLILSFTLRIVLFGNRYPQPLLRVLFFILFLPFFLSFLLL